MFSRMKYSLDLNLTSNSLNQILTAESILVKMRFNDLGMGLSAFRNKGQTNPEEGGTLSMWK